MLSCLLNSVSDLSNLFLLLALGIFIFALLGMQLFGAQFTPATGYPEVPRTNYDCIGTAMLTVFVVMSGENWNDVWADTKHAVGAGSAAFYVLLVVAGNFVTLNLFVAILLGGLPENEDEAAADDEDDASVPVPSRSSRKADSEISRQPALAPVIVLMYRK